MMKILTILLVIIAITAIFMINKNKTNNKKTNKTKLPFKELVKQTFPKYKIIEKNQMIMICEINHRNEPEELVFIRISTGTNKTIKQSGKMLIADYPYQPSAKEMKLDLGKHLN